MRLIDADKLEQELDDMIKDYECVLASNSGDVRAFGYRNHTMFIKSIVRAQPTAYDVDAVKNNINKMINNAYAEGDHDIASTLEMALGEVKKGGTE